MRPRRTFQRRSLRGWFLTTSCVLAAGAAAAATPAERIGQARALHASGRSLAAQAALEGALADPGLQAPEARLPALTALLDICLESRAQGCVGRHVSAYMAAAQAAPMADPAEAAVRLQTATYYFDAARLGLGRAEITAQILDGPGWSTEIAGRRELYLRRALLAAEVRLGQGQRAEAGAAADRLLSMVAGLSNPEADRAGVARAAAGAIAVLVDAGQAERAYGLYRATAATLPEALPARSVDLAAHRLTEARLLGGRGELRGARSAVEAALSLIRTLELEAPTRARLLGEGLTLQAATCAAAGDLACAREALAAQPPAVGADGPDEARDAYLAARAAVAALSGEAAPAPDARDAPDGRGGTYRLVAAALAASPGPERGAALTAAAGRLSAQAPEDLGAWGALGPLLVSLLLAEGPSAVQDPDAAFALFQLAARGGSAFDADAVAALARAPGELERRATHPALRLPPRRDRLERVAVPAGLAAAAATPPDGGALRHDAGKRLQLRDFAVRIARAETAGGLAKTGAGPTTLRALQAVLGPREAALAVARTPGGLAYLCVRRSGAVWRTGTADLARAKLDGRLVQQALTAGHAPSERLDAQFPVEAAGRLHDVYIRPFADCLKPGDGIVWLPGVAGLAAPLSVMLPAAPPKLEGGGWDLARADWLVRRHAISYAGSAALLTATRRAAATGGGDFDFLGVGDPVLTGETATGEARGAVATRGARVAGLAPLPETRDELLASAKGFRTSRLLLGPEATERRLRAQVTGAYTYVSFATHGLIREDLQGLAEPALVLTPVAGDDPLDDGLLTASEIADLNLRARFVALSACNTANFDLDQLARDLPALSSAFAVAGVPATLATLWPVDSETGRQVVTGAFERLRADGAAPAEALASAQRAFLVAPPGKAWLHPRFWAPFVVLGDGGAAVAPRPPQGVGLGSVEVLTTRGGEVLGLDRTGGATAARLISDADGAGRHGAAVRAAGPEGEAWRRESPGVGASRPTFRLGATLVTTGYRAGPDGRYAPVLEAVDAGGRPAGVWRAEPAAEGRDAFVLAGTAVDAGRAVLAVGELGLRGAARGRGGRLRLLETGPELLPRVLAEIDLPSGGSPAEATVSPLGGDLLVTYTDRAAPPAARPGATLDDWEEPLCAVHPVTWIELRDGRTGALKARRELAGEVAVSAIANGARVLLGGAAAPACGEDARASVAAVGPDLAPRTLWTDPSLGASEVRALAALPDGRILVAASKAAVVDFTPPPAPGAAADPYRWRRTDRTFSGMLLTLGRDGRAGPPRLLDSGSNVIVTALEASRSDDVLLGGSLAGEAAIFHLKVGR